MLNDLTTDDGTRKGGMLFLISMTRSKYVCDINIIIITVGNTTFSLQFSSPISNRFLRLCSSSFDRT